MTEGGEAIDCIIILVNIFNVHHKTKNPKRLGFLVIQKTKFKIKKESEKKTKWQTKRM